MLRAVLSSLFAAGVLAVSAPASAPVRDARTRPPAADPRAGVLAALRRPPEATSSPWRVPLPNPRGPALFGVPHPGFAAAVQGVRRCGPGDALITIERVETATVVHVRRGGAPCFRVPFADGPAGPADVRAAATVLADGTPGPLALVHARLVDDEQDGGVRERRHEAHFVVVGWDGGLLLERAIGTRSFRDAAGRGEDVSLTPLVWDGTALSAWASVRGFSGGADQCVGSLLTVPARGPIEVNEGVPCTPVGAEDRDGDGAVELIAETGPDDSSFEPWRAAVSLSGRLAAVLDSGEPVDDLLTLGEAHGASLRRDPRCGVAALHPDGTSRCAPSALPLGPDAQLLGTSFDWTGDGTGDATFAQPLADGFVLAAWAEDDQVIVRSAEALEALLPRHQVPRVLQLTGPGTTEVLVGTAAGFAIEDAATGERRWEGKLRDGVLEALAAPAP